jgi:gag-polypeptide of LTR copia-type
MAVEKGKKIIYFLLSKTIYHSWARAVTVALGGKEKLDHINGRTKPPKSKGGNFDQ